MEVFEHKNTGELRRALNLSDLIVYAIIYMLPVSPFALFGIIGGLSHGLVPLVYIFSMVAMFFTARSYMVMSGEFPVAGSAYAYAKMGLNDFAGFAAGWVVFLDYIIAPGLLCIVSSTAMHGYIPAIPKWMWILLFVGIGTSLNLVGVNVSAKYNKIMLLAMLTVLLIYLSVGGWALYSGKGNGGLTFSSLYNPEAFTWKGIGLGVLIGSTNFLGFDAVTTLGEEVKQDRRHLLGFAGIAALFMSGVLYVLQTWVATDLAPGAHIRSADTAFYDIAFYAGGHWLFALTSVATAAAFGISAMIVCQTAITRIIFAMGRDRQLPAIFAYVHPKSQQPWVANIFVAAVSLIVALAFQDHLDELAMFENFGALSAFALVNISLIGYFWFKKGSRDVFNHMIMPLIAIAIILALFVAMRPATMVMGVIWLTCGSIYYAIMQLALGRKIVIEG